MDRPALLEAMTTERARFEAALAAITAEAWNQHVNGDWTRKDTLAHVEAWERRAVTLFGILRSGGDPGSPGSGGTLDEINARFRAESRDRTLEDVRRGEAEAYRSLLGIVESASDGDLFDAARFPWLEGDPFASMVVANSTEHWADHLDHFATS